MIAGIVLTVSGIRCRDVKQTYTANGHPKRALIRVRRSSKTGIAREKIKTKTPVVTTHPLEMSKETITVTYVQTVQCCHVLCVRWRVFLRALTKTAC
jgi:hypothetical protein